MDIFSARLKWLRESKGYSQQYMAEQLGISQPYYGRIERDKGEPNLEALKKLSTILGESTDFLIGVVDYDSSILTNFKRLSVHKYQLLQASLDLSMLGDPPSDVSADSLIKKSKIEILNKRIEVISQSIPEIEQALIKRIGEIPFSPGKTDILSTLRKLFGDLIDNGGPLL